MSRMTAAAKAARTAYLREWQRKNPEKLREYRRRYWTKKAAQIEEKAKKVNEDETNKV